MRNRYWVLLFVLIFQCATNKLPKEDIIAMKARFTLEYNRNPDLWPVMVGLKEEVRDIFPVPAENAVGTNLIDFAITLLRFEGDRIRYDELISNHPGASAGGLYSHCPVFDKEWIAYGQTRGFSLFNIRTKEFIDHIPYPKLGLRITRAVAIPDQPFTFLIQIARANVRLTDRVLQIVRFDLKGGFEVLAELEQIGRHPGERGAPLIIRDGRIFDWNENVFMAYDFNLKPSQHPLTTLLNSLDEYDIRLHQCNEQAIHPELPFAIVKEILPDDSERIWLARWEHPNKDERFIRIFEQKLSVFTDIKELIISGFEFSPDGRWLLFNDWSKDIGNPSYIAMPIEKNAEYFLGKPLLLGKVLREHARPTSSAWISEPTSYVVSDGKVLYKWEFDNLQREF